MSLLLIAADLAVPKQTAAATAEPAPASAAPAPAASVPAPASSAPAGFNAVDDSTQMQSGEALLIEAYIAIWVLLFAFIVLAWLRTRKVEDKVAELEKAIERAKVTAPIPTTKRSASEPPAEPEKA